MKRAELIAREILERFGNHVPVDVEAIAKSYNLSIRTQALEESVSGMLVIKDDGGLIGVNETHHPNRQRFTVAHELGHFLLHRHASNVFIDTGPIFFRDESSSDGSKLREIQANRFAAELLMPRRILVELLRSERFDPSDDAALRRMANRIGVSSQALLIRLTKLRLIDV